VSEKELVDFLRRRTARWWLPDRVFFVPEIPMTATGWIRPTVLREQYREILLLEPPRGGRNMMPGVDPLRLVGSIRARPAARFSDLHPVARYRPRSFPIAVAAIFGMRT
jgi:hypothetical protein